MKNRKAWHILSTLAAAGVCAVANLPLPAVLDEDDLPGDFLDSLADEDTVGGVVEGWDSYGDVTVAGPAFEEVDELPVPFRLQPSREHANPLDASVDALFAA